MATVKRYGWYNEDAYEGGLFESRGEMELFLEETPPNEVDSIIIFEVGQTYRLKRETKTTLVKA